MKPIHETWLQFDYKTSSEDVFEITLEQVNRALRDRKLKIEVDELLFTGSEDWKGLLCDQHKNHPDKIKAEWDKDEPDEEYADRLVEEVFDCDGHGCVVSGDDPIRHLTIKEL